MTDAQIVEILDASRTKSSFEYGEDVSWRERVYETRGEIAILCRGAFAIESTIVVAENDCDDGKSSTNTSVSARTIVTKGGACGSLVDVLDFTPSALVGIGEETSLPKYAQEAKPTVTIQTD